MATKSTPVKGELMYYSIYLYNYLTIRTDSELQSSLRQLSLNDEGSIRDISRPTPSRTPKPKLSDVKTTKNKAEEVADSWEDEADSDADSGPPTPTAPTSSSTQKLDTGLDNDNENYNDQEGPRDPPPTPISPQTSQPSQQSWPAPSGREAPIIPAYGNPSGASSRSAGPARRPEKQTAVAGRMIAGALGIRAPRRTEEQKAYDRSVKEQEIRRRNREREEAAKAREEEERAKAAVWDG